MERERRRTSEHYSQDDITGRRLELHDDGGNRKCGGSPSSCKLLDSPSWLPVPSRYLLTPIQLSNLYPLSCFPSLWSSIEYPLEQVCEHPVPWQTFKHTLGPYSMFTAGAIQRPCLLKTGPLLLNGGCLSWHCGGNDHALTIGFHTERKAERQRESSMHGHNNVCL